MTEEEEDNTKKKDKVGWKNEMKELMKILASLPAPSLFLQSYLKSGDSSSSKGLEPVEDMVGSPGPVRFCGLEGQDFSIFKVGDLVELVPSSVATPLLPYLLTLRERKYYPLSERFTPTIKDFYRLLMVKRGLVIGKGEKGTEEIFENATSIKGGDHGMAEYLEILIGDEEVEVTVFGASCDRVKSLTVRKMEGDGE